MIDELKQNIETEIEVLREVSNNIRRMDYASESERKLLQASIESLKNSMKIINSAIPEMLEDITIIKRLPSKGGREKETGIEHIEYKGPEAVIRVNLPKADREQFIKQLSINENLVKRLKRKQVVQEEKFEELKAARGYLKLANRVFLDLAQKFVRKGRYKSLSMRLKKANIDVLFGSYIAMILFTTLIALFLSIAAAILFFFFDFSLSSPFISVAADIGFGRIGRVIWIPFAFPIVVYLLLYYYPTTERDSLAKKIEQELPFAVIHMSAISGSGIAPVEIFKIIGLSKEYPYLRKEVRKVLNQINIYGYDLVTSLNNVSKTTPSTRLAELFAGLSTTITSGGNLSEFFEKRSESLLLTYRLDREKYTKIAETFMDIYISVVIAAPMILMILLVMISVSNFQTGYTLGQMTMLMLLIVSVINVVFITFLHLKQPVN
jgi:flagellar protein FlaJ